MLSNIYLECCSCSLRSSSSLLGAGPVSERKQAAGKAQVHCARAINGHQRLSLLYPFTPARTFMVQARLMKVLSNGLCFSRPPWGWDPVSGLKMMGLRQEMRRSKLCEYVHYQKQGISSLQAAQKGVGGLPTSYWVGLIEDCFQVSIPQHVIACRRMLSKSWWYF